MVPDAPAEAPKTVKRPTIPRHVAGEMREAFAEIKAARNGGPPLMTEEQFWAAFHADTDASDDAI